MTDQSAPPIKFREEQYWLIREVPFSPYDYGIGAYEESTDNGFGYDAVFAIRDDRLYLDALITTHDENHIALLNRASQQSVDEFENKAFDIDSMFAPAPGVKKSDPPPALNGVDPKKSYGSQWSYNDLNMLLDYNGALVLSSCRHEVSEFYDESGQVASAWLLEFKKGRIESITQIDELDSFLTINSYIRKPQ